MHSIVQENGDTKKVYLPDEKDENFIASIITIEKKTGNKIINLEKHIEQVLSNSLGRENFVNNPELKPTEKFEVPVDVKGHDGEKTYYSNGAIETDKKGMLEVAY